MNTTTKKKLYISCPMKGRTEEAIRHDMDRLHKVAEVTFDQELEVIPTYVKHDPPETGNKAIWCLGESIKKMSEADYFIGVRWCDGARGCRIEDEVAQAYGIPSTYVDCDTFMPEVNAQWRKEQVERFAAEQGCCTGNVRAHMPVFG